MDSTSRITRFLNKYFTGFISAIIIVGLIIAVLLGVRTDNFMGSLSTIGLVGVVVLALLPTARKRFLKSSRRLPTSKIRSVAMGVAELQGTLKMLTPLYTPVGNKECIGYWYKVEKPERDAKGRIYFVTVQSNSACNDFLLKDETGEIRVEAEKLDYSGLKQDESFTVDGYRHTQYILSAGDKMVAIGSVNTDKDNKLFLEPDTVRGLFYMAPVQEAEGYTGKPQIGRAIRDFWKRACAPPQK